MHHHQCPQHIRSSRIGSASIVNYLDHIVYTSDDASMDEIYLTYVDDEHDYNHGYADNTHVVKDIDQVKSSHITSD